MTLYNIYTKLFDFIEDVRIALMSEEKYQQLQAERTKRIQQLKWRTRGLDVNIRKAQKEIEELGRKERELRREKAELLSRLGRNT